MSTTEARRIQDDLRRQTVLTTTWDRLSVIGAVDCSHAPQDSMGAAAITLYRFPDLVELSHTVIDHPVNFPYVPGLLAFRELPLIIAAIESLSQMPDLWLVDGHGIAHPRRMGIATHLGVLLDVPTIGCAKSILVGQGRAPSNARGSWTPLTHKGDIIGAQVRTRAGTKPIIVSPGHRVDLKTAVDVVLQCCDGLRIPKPIRDTDRLVRGRARRR